MNELWIEITIGHGLGGGSFVCPGDRLMAPRDLTPDQAKAKIRQGYAREIPAPVSEKPETVVHADPEPDDRDPEITSANRPRAGRRTR